MNLIAFGAQRNPKPELTTSVLLERLPEKALELSCDLRLVCITGASDATALHALNGEGAKRHRAE